MMFCKKIWAQSFTILKAFGKSRENVCIFSHLMLQFFQRNVPLKQLLNKGNSAYEVNNWVPSFKNIFFLQLNHIIIIGIA